MVVKSTVPTLFVIAKFPLCGYFNPNQSGMPVDSKGVAVGILIPTDVDLLIPTPQCPSFGNVKTAKTLDFESSVEVLRDLRSVYKMNQL